MSDTLAANTNTQKPHTLTIVADSNIASLNDFFNAHNLAGAAESVEIVTCAGREITADFLATTQPDVLLVRSVTPVNEALLANNNSVRFVGSATIGTDHIDQAYLKARGIAFANAAGCSKHSVAQYVLTAVFTLRPEYWHDASTLGIIGLGNIGSTLALYAKDLGWQVLGYDPLLPASDINNSTLDEVLQNSHIISLHVPLTSAQQSDYPTEHLIDAKALAKMPKDTLLINSARGPVIAEADLLTNIAKTKRQVVLDVFEHEPSIAAEMLDALSIATMHIAGYTLEGKLRGTQMIYDALCQTLGLPIVQSIGPLLPANPYHWAALKDAPQLLPEFYDIMQDDAALRAVVTEGQVQGKDFDGLRRNYPLRREWAFAAS